ARGAVEGGAGGALAVAPAAVGSAGLVADRIAEAAPLPAQAGPLGPDGPVDRPGTRARGPVDRPAVGEVVEPPDAVGSPGLVGDRIAEEGSRPTEGQVVRPDVATYGPGPGARRPVDGGAVPDVGEPADAVGVPGLGCAGIAAGG